MRAHQAEYPVTTMCRLLGVSASGFYAWRRRGPSSPSVEDRALIEEIRRIHTDSRGIYGAPRIHRELQARGHQVGVKRVARLMRAEGLCGVTRRKFIRTTRRDRLARRAPDLVERSFEAEGPDQLWVADITYVPTCKGFLYLSVILDVWSRLVVG